MGNLTGWHVLIILGVLLVAALIVVAVVVSIVVSARRRAGSSGSSVRVPVAQRLAEFDELRDRGAVTATEYDAKRSQLLDGL